MARSLLTGLAAFNSLMLAVSARSVSCSSTPFQLQGSPIAIDDTTTQSIVLQANCGYSWDVKDETDVTTWFVDCDGQSTFLQTGSVAQAASVNGTFLSIALDASKIAGFNTNGPSTLSIQPPAGALSGGQSAYTPTDVYVGSYTIPKLSIISTITGTAYTHAKSTLKEMFGVKVTYDPSDDAKVWLELPGIDDVKINSDNATVTLVGGDGYYTSEYTLNATTLAGAFVNGRTTYSLSEGDLEINTSVYPLKDIDSGREWSCLGGDGEGNYIFNLQLAGITYNGLPIAPQTFRIHIYIYGYNYGFNATSDATVKYGNGTTVEPVIAPLSSKVESAPKAGATPVFTWVGEHDKPCLVDAVADDFYITWPSNVDASKLEACDITLTMLSVQGDSHTLAAGEDYVVSTSTTETQIAVTFLNWAFEPVFTTLNITVDPAALKGKHVSSAALSTSYDITSVYVYLAQQGGGGTMIDGTVTAYSYYGLANATNVNQLFTPVNYTLTTTVNGTTQYFDETSNSTGNLVDTLAAATTYDGSGVDDENLQLIGNTVWVTTRINVTATKTVNGSPVTFTKAYAGGASLTPSVVETYLAAAPGYIFPPALDTAELAGVDADEFNNTWIYHEKWAWQPKIQIGFHGIDITPYTGKFEWTQAKGSSQQFTASAWLAQDAAAAADVSWVLYGNLSSGTTLSSEGLLTVGANETATSVAVIVKSNTDKSYNGIGTVNVAIS